MSRHQPSSPISQLGDLLELPANERRALAQQATALELKAGEVLINQGDPGREAIWLIVGELLVERDGEAIAVLSPGAVVGEQALLLNELRNATVTAATDVTIAAMNRREFATTLDTCPTLARSVLHSAVDRGSAALA